VTGPRGLLARRALSTLPVLLGVSILSFGLLRLLPGDPAVVLGGTQASEPELEEIRREHALDQPVAVQYGRFLLRALHGDLGRSIRTRQPVAAMLGGALALTVVLATVSVGLALVVGVTTGVVAARRANSAVDVLTMLAALTGVSMPVFWSGLLLLLVFAGWLGWLPAGGYGRPAHLVLPVVALGLGGAGAIARLTRGAMLETLGQDYVRTARAKGLPESAVVVSHALRNALNPVLTVVGLQFGFLLGGSVLTETVFALPGIGRVMVTALLSRDYPVVQGGMLLVAGVFVVVNFLTDVGYALLDPRLREP
jgi:ABC-type dipeptide/oligopeptide/nickel transport system permease component